MQLQIFEVVELKDGNRAIILKVDKETILAEIVDKKRK